MSIALRNATPMRGRTGVQSGTCLLRQCGLLCAPRTYARPHCGMIDADRQHNGAGDIVCGRRPRQNGRPDIRTITASRDRYRL
jgi:hypothetical protein